MFLQNQFSFSKDHQRILKSTTFSETQPGELLHDFSAILEILRLKKITLTPKAQFPMKMLSELNDSLKHPNELGLKRPQQKSYPKLHGLFLLIRASGLSSVDTSGKKPKLSIVDSIYEQWQSFNPAEQYGNLLEAWFFRGYEEIIGERSRWETPDHMQQITDFYGRLKSRRGLEVDYLPFSPGWHNIGLLELFGMVDIQYAPVIDGQGIQIDRLTFTPFVEALTNLIYDQYLKDLQILEFGFASQLFGVLQPEFSPYFTEWKRTLELPQWEFRDGTYTVNVSLGKAWSSQIRLNGQATFEDLADGILISVGFDFDHLYEFSLPTRFGKEFSIHHSYMDDYPHVSEIKIGDVPLRVGSKFTFLFDFGDNWLFDIQLEVFDETPSKKTMEIISTKGKPPEQYPSWDE